MESYLLLLLIIPSATAFVDCRTACRTCRDDKEHSDVLEVYCAMCQECKQRRRERMMFEGTSKKYHREGAPELQNPEPQLHRETINYPEPSQYTEPSKYTEIHYSETQEIEGCPIQSPCSDSEEYVPPPTPIQHLALTKKVPPLTMTTTTTTTTRKPCPTFKPCKKKTTTLPPRIPAMPLPPPPPLMPIAPPPYPVPGCYMPMPSIHPVYPCPGYPYMGLGPGPMGPPGPMPGIMAQGFNQRYNWGSSKGQKGHIKESFENHGRYTKNIHHEESYENQGRHHKGTPVHIGESNENHGRYTDSIHHEESSGSGEEGPGGSIVVVKPTPSIMSLKAAKKDDFVYLYVGVPKNIMKS